MGPASPLSVAVLRTGPALAWAPRDAGWVVWAQISKNQRKLITEGLNNCPYCSPLHQFSLLHAGFLCLRSENLLAFALGVTILGVCHYTLTVKGSHLATHGALTESKRWSKIWVLFFVEVSLGLGGSSCWYWVGESRCVQLCVPSRAGSCSCGLWAQVCSLHYGGCVSVCARPQALERVEGCMRNDEYLTVAADVV